MRTFRVEVPCAMGAAEYWELKYNYEVERTAALNDGRVLTLRGETRGTDVDGNATVTRSVGCAFAQNPVPPALRRLVDASKIDSEVDIHWRPQVWNESHPCHTVVRLPHFEKVLTISSTQWLIERTASSCTVCSKVHVDCRALGIGGLIESCIEKDMTTALQTFPLRAISYKNLSLIHI